MAQMILDIPDFSSKAKIAGQAMAGTYDAVTYIVSYVGKWKYPQLGRTRNNFGRLFDKCANIKTK